MPIVRFKGLRGEHVLCEHKALFMQPTSFPAGRPHRLSHRVLRMRVGVDGKPAGVTTKKAI